MATLSRLRPLLRRANHVSTLIVSALREIFDENSWQRFVARNAAERSTFNDFVRERHTRPRQHCC
jgi:hypothetical protein